MKIIKYFNYIAIMGLIFFAVACEDAYDPYPAFETVPHGLGQIKAGTPTSMFFGDNNSKLEGTLQWISTDKAVVVTEIDYYVTWTEGFLDKDGIPKTAAHGKKKLNTLASPGPARTVIPFMFTASDVYQLFKDVTYDYDDGVGSRSVFGNPKDSDRSPSSYFTPNDRFVFSWGFKGDDGRYFDSWSPGICNNSVGANCTLNFNIVCASALAGTYNYSTVGWCGGVKSGTLEIKTKGTGTYEIFVDGGADPDFSLGAYDACYGPGSTLPGGSLILNDVCNKLFFTGVSRWGEVYTFNSITVNGGTLILDWKNDYDPEAGVTTITRTDGKNWPSLRK